MNRPDPTGDRRLTTLARPRRLTMGVLARAATLLMLVVVVASAWLRLAQPRPPCADWPACRGTVGTPGPARALSAPESLGAPPVLAAVRGTHRFAATAVLLASLALVALALAREPRQRKAGALATAMLALALGLAALGIVTPGSRSAFVLLGNLLGGQLLLALAWALACELDARPALSPASAVWARAGVVLWLAQAAAGAVSGAGLAAAAPVLHIALALAALPVAFGVGLAARGQRRRAEAQALVAIAALQTLLGLAAATSGAAPVLVLAHSGTAALGLALLLGLGAAGAR